MGDLADRDRRPEQRGPRLSDPSASAGFFCRHPLLVLRTVAPFPRRKAGVPALTSLLPPPAGDVVILLFPYSFRHCDE